MDIIELQHQLSENRGTLSSYRPRTASTTTATSTIPKMDHSKDAIELLEGGVDPHEVADLCGMHMSEITRMQEYTQKRMLFKMTGNPANI